jgi:hypothetical protein
MGEHARCDSTTYTEDDYPVWCECWAEDHEFFTEPDEPLDDNGALDRAQNQYDRTIYGGGL